MAFVICSALLAACATQENQSKEIEEVSPPAASGSSDGGKQVDGDDLDGERDQVDSASDGRDLDQPERDDEDESDVDGVDEVGAAESDDYGDDGGVGDTSEPEPIDVDEEDAKKSDRESVEESTTTASPATTTTSTSTTAQSTTATPITASKSTTATTTKRTTTTTKPTTAALTPDKEPRKGFELEPIPDDREVRATWEYVRATNAVQQWNSSPDRASECIRLYYPTAAGQVSYTDCVEPVAKPGDESWYRLERNLPQSMALLNGFFCCRPIYEVWVTNEKGERYDGFVDGFYFGVDVPGSFKPTEVHTSGEQNDRITKKLPADLSQSGAERIFIARAVVSG